MDIVKLLDSVAKNPFALLIVLMLLLWYAGLLLQRKDNYIEKHFRDDLKEYKEREKQHREDAKELNNKLWEVMRERRENGDFEGVEDPDPPSPTTIHSNVRTTRRKLPK